jgi:hypothetical protein
MRWLILLTLVSSAALVGCGDKGPKKYPVSGTVTVDGKPVPKGSIVFANKGGGNAPDAGTIVDGNYKFEATEGVKRVEITASREKAGINPAMGAAPKEEYIPARFNTASTLEANVTAAGPNTFNFQVNEK